MGAVSLTPTLSPHGRLALIESPDATPLNPEIAERLQRAFERGAGHGLLQLGAAETGAAIPAVFSYWREFGAAYITALCAHTDPDATARTASIPPPDMQTLERL